MRAMRKWFLDELHALLNLGVKAIDGVGRKVE